MFEFLLFLSSVAFALAAWGYVCAVYVWPRLSHLSLADAARPLVVLHLFRFIGASFLIPGVAGTALGRSFAEPGAYGDLIAMGLAWIALGMLNRAGGVAMLWVFNVWGLADLLFAFYEGGTDSGFQPGFLGATFFVVTFCVPLLICSHVMLFMLLTRRTSVAVPTADAVDASR